METTKTVSDAQWEVVKSQDDTTLAEWWCALNSWRWPDLLPEPEPPHPYLRGGVRSQIMHWIHNKVGDTLISRIWNKDMPDDVFASFRRHDRGPDTPYGQWTERKIAERMARIQERDNAVLVSEFVLDDILDADEVE